jgi:pimeloyl-ACP methyl ester carboxylesterase
LDAAVWRVLAGWTLAGVLAASLWPMAASAAETASPSSQAQRHPCRLPGLDTEAQCGHVSRPLDPALPAGRQIDVHFAVLPALARNKKPDPVFFFAGGPGQSAIDLAATVSRLLARFSNRRDIVLIDQRGTGRSAPLQCDAEPPTAPLADAIDPARQIDQLRRCRARLMQLPYGDLRQFTTTIAMADADAVRRALGVAQVNLVGGSYGTRAALEYLRQFPQAVRRVVIDGVAPPGMALPASFSTDGQAAFDALVAYCSQDAPCHQHYPDLGGQWQRLLASLPLPVTLTQPVTGQPQPLTLTRPMLTGLVRGPLYAPTLASLLPYALSEAAQGRFGALVGASAALQGGGAESGLAMGMHFSVVCAEDEPRVALSADRPGRDFGTDVADLYRQVCDGWPRGAVPAAFYRVPKAPVATLLLSGGIDPVTPPRHAERVARDLGPKAKSVVVPNAGHGLMALPCIRDVVFRFIDAATDDEALKVDASCAASIPRAPAYVPLAGAVPATSTSGTP